MSDILKAHSGLLRRTEELLKSESNLAVITGEDGVMRINPIQSAKVVPIDDALKNLIESVLK